MASGTGAASRDSSVDLGDAFGRDGYAPLARGMAVLFAAASAFAGAALAVSSATVWGTWGGMALIGASLSVATLCWTLASRLDRWGVRCLAVLGTVPTALAVYACEGPGSGGGSVEISREHWFLTVGTFLLAGILVHRLFVRLRQVVADLAHAARTDQLTQVPNRRAWDEALVLQSARRGGGGFSVALLDIDHFKSYNDTRGHPEGDALLQRVAAAWRGMLRSGDLLARYGGEEFAVLMPRTTVPQAADVVERLRAAVPEGQTASAGVATWDGREQPSSVLARADVALYRAKREGRDRTVIAEWTPRDLDRPDDEMLRRVHQLLDQWTMVMQLEPVVRLDDMTVVGHEAVGRAVIGGLPASPASLFGLARRSGVVRELDWLCRRRALEAARSLPAQLDLHLNVDGGTLMDPLHDVEQLLLLLRYVGRSPATLVLDICEADLPDDVARLAQVLDTYRRHGIRVALDEVGDGAASLTAIAVLRPDIIKLSHRLIAGPGSQAVLTALLSFAAAIGSTVFAGGVDSAEAAAALRLRGVQLAQGSHVARLGAGRRALGFEPAGVVA